MPICCQKSMLCHIQSRGRTNNSVLRPLTHCNNDTGTGEQSVFAQADHISLVIKGCLLIDNAFVRDFHRAETVAELYTICHSIFHLPHTGRSLIASAEYGHPPGALAQSGTRHIHGGISCTDDYQLLSQIINIRIYQIIDGKMHISEAFTLDAKLPGLPYAGTNKDCLVAVPLQIVQRQGTANRGIGPDFDSHSRQLFLVTIQDRFRKAEVRNTIPQHTADFFPTFKNCNIISFLRQQNADRDACRAASDDRNALAVPWLDF